MTILSHPNQIRIGFNRRDDTYSGLLAYIIYMNSGTKYGKEKSFNSWIDGNIPIQDVPNDFFSGFVLNKTVSRNYHSSSGVAAFRIYHPNGYEFEIKPSNFANICSNCDISSGEIMEPCTIAWEGADLVLVPQSFITQKIVNLKSIDVVSKLLIKEQEFAKNLQEGKFVPVNKLKAESIYLHDDGKEYFLSAFIKDKYSLLNHNPAAKIEADGTFLYDLKQNYSNHTPAIPIIPYAVDGNQHHIVNNDFMSRFITKVEKPLTTVMRKPHFNEMFFIPFHQMHILSNIQAHLLKKSLLLLHFINLIKKTQHLSLCMSVSFYH